MRAPSIACHYHQSCGRVAALAAAQDTLHAASHENSSQSAEIIIADETVGATFRSTLEDSTRLGIRTDRAGQLLVSHTWLGAAGVARAPRIPLPR